MAALLLTIKIDLKIFNKCDQEDDETLLLVIAKTKKIKTLNYCTKITDLYGDHPGLIQFILQNGIYKIHDITY